MAYKENVQEGDLGGAILGSCCGLGMIACIIWMSYCVSQMIKAIN
jgi:hypothetical protein